MEIELKSTLEHAQLGSIAAAHVARTFYGMVMGTEPDADEAFINEVELAVGEACTNAVRHSPNPDDGESDFTLCFRLTKDQLIIEIKDHNPPFAFDEVPTPDFDSLPEGGYGIHLMKSTMDNVNYSHEDGWNIITMKKHLQKETLAI